MHIYFTVTNDLSYDQRMQRICTTLAENGYRVTLVGRRKKDSLPFQKRVYEQHRIPCWFSKGKFFYAEYNLRLFFFLLFRKMNGICAIDLDTILPCLYISKWKKIPRVYDAHELFTEMKEVISRPKVQNAWLKIEKKAVPQFRQGYTVSESIAAEFNKRYAVQYETIRNVPVLREIPPVNKEERYLVYLGAVNEARGFEKLVPAMRDIKCKLVVCGDGNFMPQLKKLVQEYNLQNKIILKGMLGPEELWEEALAASIGISIPERKGLNQYFALPNKFFDYIHAGLPQVTCNFPEYRKINREFEVALLLDKTGPKEIAEMVNYLLDNDVLYNTLRENCLKARKLLNWQKEQEKLLAFYKTIFAH